MSSSLASNLAHRRVFRRKHLAATVTCAVFLMLASGCATIKPEPLTAQGVTETSAADLQGIKAGVEPITAALSLNEAIARAIKYNLVRQVKMMDEAISLGQLEADRYDLLPKVVASAGYRERSNDLISRSKDSVTGEPSLSHPYISSDRSAFTNDLSLTWSLLDFGQSYYAAKQSADRSLIAGERRRKALHLLIQDVRSAFWRAASAQKLRSEVQATIAEAESALGQARQAEAERLRNPLDSLRYQRQLLENLRLLENINQELSSAQVELSALINVPLGSDYRIAEPEQAHGTAWLDVPVEKLEQQAIASNADLRESFYNVRLAHEEARRNLLRFFPGISFNYGTHGSDDSYLINKRWNDAGVQLSYNLLGLFSLPAQQRLGDAREKLAERQRQATLMAVLAQVHLSRLQYANAQQQFQRADSISKIDHSIAEHVAKREQAQTQTRQDRIANQTGAILSELRRYQALAQVNAAASKLQATLGLEPAITVRPDTPLAELTQQIANSMQQWDQGKGFDLSAAN